MTKKLGEIKIYANLHIIQAIDTSIGEKVLTQLRNSRGMQEWIECTVRLSVRLSPLKRRSQFKS